MIQYAAVVLAAMSAANGIASSGYAKPAAAGPVKERHGGWMARSANPKHAWLYVAGYDNNVINIYDLDKFGLPRVGSITQGITNPDGITLDSQGTLYVPDATAQAVSIYPAGAVAPTLTLSVPGRAECVAVDAAGNVYVGVRASTSGIAVFPPGQTTMSQYIASSLIQSPAEIAFDASGTLYITDDNTGVLVLPPGVSESVSSLGLSGLAPGATSGLALNPLTGEFYVSFSNTPTQVLEFAAGQQHAERERHLGWGPADFMTSGILHGHVYVFLPDGDSDVVYIYKSKLRGSPVALTTSSQSVQGLAFKPAGVP
jgi:hypothetical protein